MGVGETTDADADADGADAGFIAATAGLPADGGGATGGFDGLAGLAIGSGSSDSFAFKAALWASGFTAVG